MVRSGYGADRLYRLPLLVDYQKREQLEEKSKKKYEREGNPREERGGPDTSRGDLKCNVEKIPGSC